MALRAIIDGRLGSDPEIRYTQTGKAVTTLSIGCTARVKDRNGEWEDDGEPLWIRVHLWEEQAELAANLLRKGMAVHAEGVLVKRSWQDKSGQVRINDELKMAKVWPTLKASDTSQTPQTPASRDLEAQGMHGYQQTPKTSQNGVGATEAPPPPF